MSTWVAGADGCRGGWVVALRRAGLREPVIRTVAAISQVLGWHERPAALGIDIPIGLLDRAEPGGRECDRAARALLGEPRGRSVFSPPARQALGSRTFEQAVRRNRRTSEHHLGISRQSFGILPKIREVDDFVSQNPDLRVLEVHPELSFYEMNRGKAIPASKKSESGFRRRLRLLESTWRCELAPVVEAHRSSKIARDDIVDAMAVCWTAQRVLEGRAIRIPSEPRRDSRGLPMEIVR